MENMLFQFELFIDIFFKFEIELFVINKHLCNEKYEFKIPLKKRFPLIMLIKDFFFHIQKYRKYFFFFNLDT